MGGVRLPPNLAGRDTLLVDSPGLRCHRPPVPSPIRHAYQAGLFDVHILEVGRLS